MTTYATSWTVYAGTKRARTRNEFDLIWKPISRKFTVKSAADQFAALAAKQMPGVRIEVRAALRDDGIRM